MAKRMMIAPSILSADFGRLDDEISAINQSDCEFLHLDIMDGHFVPNLTFGLCVAETIAKKSKKPLDIHLMVQNAEFFINYFAPLKPAIISIHAESEAHINRVINLIKNHNIKAGIVLNPHTSQECLEYIVRYVDLVLLMSVNPGFSAQKFITSTLEKAIKVRGMIDAQNPRCLLEMDGGICDKNIDLVKDSGVDLVVSGSYIFGSKNYQKAIDSLR